MTSFAIRVPKLLMLLSLALILTPPPQPASAGWVDQWLDQKTSTSTSSARTQRRGYFNAGSFSARWRQSNDYLLSITPPRLGGGCGGVDLFLGGVTFMDPEYLVQKLQRLVQAAPALAFSVAMDAMSKTLSNKMSEFERIIDGLNQLQVNDCRLSQRLVAAVDPNDPGTFKDVLAEIDQGELFSKGLTKNFQQRREQVTANKGRADQSLMGAVANCPAEFRAIFQTGSLIDNIASRSGLTALAPIMRGYVGDIEIDTSGNVPTAKPVPPCAANQSLEGVDLLSGQAQARPAGGGACYEDNADGLQTTVQDALTAFAANMSSRANPSNLTPQTRKIALKNMYPVYAVLAGFMATESDPSIAIDRLTPHVATLYANSALRDLYQALSFMLDRGNASLKILGVQDPAAQSDCRADIALPVTSEMKAMRTRVEELSQAAQAAYYRSRRQMVEDLEVALKERELVETARRAALQQGPAR